MTLLCIFTTLYQICSFIVNKIKYEALELEIIKFQTEDIITDSDPYEDD